MSGGGGGGGWWWWRDGCYSQSWTCIYRSMVTVLHCHHQVEGGGGGGMGMGVVVMERRVL